MPSISVFDASLLWFDENPRDEAAGGYGLHGWITLLTRNRASYDLAYELLSEIARGSIKAKQISRLAGLPQSWKETLGSLPGDLDPRGTKVAIGDLVKFAIDRNQKPEFLAHLIPACLNETAPHRTGGRNRAASLRKRPSTLFTLAASLTRSANPIQGSRKRSAAGWRTTSCPAWETTRNCAQPGGANKSPASAALPHLPSLRRAPRLDVCMLANHCNRKRWSPCIPRREVRQRRPAASSRSTRVYSGSLAQLAQN